MSFKNETYILVQIIKFFYVQELLTSFRCPKPRQYVSMPDFAFNLTELVEEKRDFFY